ncbi:MAG: hypothetical protein AAGA08_16895 [Pseudomonadota bacterium]
MSTLKTLRDRIIFETNRENDETITDTQLNAMIYRAIRKYSRKRWEFNEQTKTVTTAADNEFVAEPAGLFSMDSVLVTIGGHEYPLKKRSNKVIEDWHGATNTSGQPTDYAYQNKQFRIWPTPNAVYTLHVLGIYDVDTAPNVATPAANWTDTDSNAWTDEGQDLLCHRVKYVLARDVLFDNEMLRNSAIGVTEAKADLGDEAALKQSTGQMRVHL